MQLLIHPDGQITCLYDETIDLASLGSLAISRASHVEPDESGRWHADLSRSAARRSDHSIFAARRSTPSELGSKRTG